MKKYGILALILICLSSACGGSAQPTGENVNNNNSNPSPSNLPPPSGNVISQDTQLFKMIAGATWVIHSYPANSGIPEIPQDVEVAFNPDGSFNTMDAPAFLKYKIDVYEPPTVLPPDQEYISNAPAGATTYNGLFDAHVSWDIIDTAMKPILKVTLAGTFYPSCGGSIGTCAQGGFDPTPSAKTQSISYVVDIKDDNNFATQVKDYYITFTRK